jgi:hypothetical protein
MGETHRVEIEIDSRCYVALQDESERLGVDVEQVVQRAMSAWLSDIAESSIPVGSVDAKH